MSGWTESVVILVIDKGDTQNVQSWEGSMNEFVFVLGEGLEEQQLLFPGSEIPFEWSS